MSTKLPGPVEVDFRTFQFNTVHLKEIEMLKSPEFEIKVHGQIQNAKNILAILSMDRSIENFFQGKCIP